MKRPWQCEEKNTVIEIHNLPFIESLLISYSTVTEYMQEWEKNIQVPVWFSTKKQEETFSYFRMLFQK